MSDLRCFSGWLCNTQRAPLLLAAPEVARARLHEPCVLALLWQRLHACAAKAAAAQNCPRTSPRSLVNFFLLGWKFGRWTCYCPRAQPFRWDSSRRGCPMGFWPRSSEGGHVAKSALVPSESQSQRLLPFLPKVDKIILSSPLLSPPAELFPPSSFCLSLLLLFLLSFYF